jgi:hypothetical protein
MRANTHTHTHKLHLVKKEKNLLKHHYSQHRREGEGEREVVTLVRGHQIFVMHARSPRVVAPKAHDFRIEV